MPEAALAAFETPAVQALIADGNSNAARMRLAALIAESGFGDGGLDDEMLVMIRDQFRRFTDEKVAPLRPWLAYQGCADPDGRWSTNWPGSACSA